jgi:hypothetical protein
MVPSRKQSSGHRSLDGISLAGEPILEIKCLYEGREPTL